MRGQPIEFINIAWPIHLLVASLPHSTPTKVTVSGVCFLHERYPRRVACIFNRIGSIANDAPQALSPGWLWLNPHTCKIFEGALAESDLINHEMGGFMAIRIMS